jgi:cation transport regulator ChaB/phage I-like protein/predicted RNA-binding Zn-ribbon protein involved in translation (DUF1610 family)
MPYTKQTLPDAIKNLPSHARDIWLSAYNSAYKQYNKDETKSNAVAWAAVKTQYYKIKDNWVKKSSEVFDCECIKCSYKIVSEKHCIDIKCPKCGGAMRRIERPGMGRTSEFINSIDLQSLTFGEDGMPPKEIQILPVGNWKHPSYGKIEIKENDLDNFIQNFNNGVRKGIPITEGHSVGEEEKPAIGWFKELVNKGRDGLWAIVEWTKEGAELLKSKAYKYFSPEFYDSYEDPETHKIYQNVLVGGALTNRPYFKGLKAIVFSELTKGMNIKELLEKEPTELTDEEVVFLKENQEELTDEQKETFKSVLEEGKEEEKKEEEKEEKEEEKEEEEEEEKDASEKTIVSKKALKFLESQAQEGVKAMAILRTEQATNYAKEMTFSETNQKGTFLPKSRDKIVKFLLSLSDAQQKSFKELVAELPQVKVFSELGEDSGLEIKATEQINKLVQEKMGKNAKLEYRQALEQVFAENPELQTYSENS